MVEHGPRAEIRPEALASLFTAFAERWPRRGYGGIYLSLARVDLSRPLKRGLPQPMVQNDVFIKITEGGEISSCLAVGEDLPLGDFSGHGFLEGLTRAFSGKIDQLTEQIEKGYRAILFELKLNEEELTFQLSPTFPQYFKDSLRKQGRLVYTTNLVSSGEVFQKPNLILAIERQELNRILKTPGVVAGEGGTIFKRGERETVFQLMVLGNQLYWIRVEGEEFPDEAEGGQKVDSWSYDPSVDSPRESDERKLRKRDRRPVGCGGVVLKRQGQAKKEKPLGIE